LHRTGTIFSRRYKQPKEVNYRQIEKDILDEVMGPKVVLPFQEGEDQLSTFFWQTVGPWAYLGDIFVVSDYL
jgi:hypothetical protein